MRKTIFRLLTVAMVLFFGSFEAQARWDDIHGDVNRTFTVDIEDVSQLIDNLLSGDTKYIGCDIDGDLEVDINDVVVLVDYLLGAIDDWPWLYKGPEKPDSALVFTVNGVSFAMMPVEGCDGFCVFKSEEHTPYNTFPVRDFYIGQTQVTYELWEAVMGSRPNRDKDAFFSYYPFPSHPASVVTWYDCQEFITRLNELTGREFHLPNLVQWLYSATGGKWTHGYYYAGSDDFGEVAWGTQAYGYDNFTFTGWMGNPVVHMPVGLKKPNELGLYDMSGNGYEWLYDNIYTYQQGDVISPDQYSYDTAFLIGANRSVYYRIDRAKTTIDALTFRLALQMDE